MSLKKRKKEILYKVGRNIFSYQKIENLLKIIHILKDLPINKNERNEKVEFINEITLGTSKNLLLSKNKPASTGLTISIEYPKDYYDNKEKILAIITSERNELVHHSKSKFDMTSIDKCKKLEKKLDKEYKHTKKEIKFFKNHLKDIKKKFTYFKEQFKDNKNIELVKKMILENTYLNDQLVINLFKLYKNDKNSLVSLDEAGFFINDNFKEEVIIMKKEYKSLKKFMLKTTLFDIIVEKKTDRLFYKVKKEFEHLL